MSVAEHLRPVSEGCFSNSGWKRCHCDGACKQRGATLTVLSTLSRNGTKEITHSQAESTSMLIQGPHKPSKTWFP